MKPETHIVVPLRHLKPAALPKRAAGTTTRRKAERQAKKRGRR